MTVIAGKSITANIAAGKHREKALNAVLKAARGFKVPLVAMGQEG